MMKKLTTLLFLALLFTLSLNAQRNCATMEVLDRLQSEHPDLLNQMQAIERHTETYVNNGLRQRETIVIPVVVHVVYYDSRENISDAQIQSQIDVLNEDFRALNSDLGNVPSEFTGVIGDVEIEFCLADTDPNGNPTSGITRKRSNRRSWGTNDFVKRSFRGGVDPWDASQYLNIWVCNIGNGILGYAQFPGGPAATDGVVIDYRYMGRGGSALRPYDQGRTGTHEVGHWLNLRHIWGDASCGNDFVNDTPTHDRANYGCPSYPHYSLCSGSPLEMTMNYMDYTEDRCMYMFSDGQAARMQAVLAPGGFRAGLRNSTGCASAGGGDPNPDPEPEVCNVPSGLNTADITTNTATLSWNTVGNAQSYNIRLRQAGTSNWTTGNSATPSVNATGLTPNTQYEWQVQTNCNSTSSAFSPSATFTTQEEVVQPPIGGTECGDNFENNNSKLNAAAIPVNVTIKALIGTPTDGDWYVFQNTSSTPNIQVSLSNLTRDYDIRLLRGNTTVKTSFNAGTADELITYNSSIVNTYYVYVSGYRGAFDPENCYDLKVTLSGSRFRTSSEDESFEVELKPVYELIVFPNPASTELTLDVPVTEEVSTQIAVFDMAGKLVLQKTDALSKGNSQTKLNVSQLPNGVYLLRVQNGNYIENRKFVISR